LTALSVTDQKSLNCNINHTTFCSSPLTVNWLCT